MTVLEAGAMSDTEDCRRCGDPIDLPERFSVHAYDYNESNGAFVEGPLCPACWDELVVFLDGAELATNAVDAIAEQVEARQGRESPPGGRR